MNSLRRELFERHRWPIVAVLIVVLIAVPVLLRGHATASADSNVPAPPKAAPPAPPVKTATHKRAPRHDAHSSPFVSPVKARSKASASHDGSSGSSASLSTTTPTPSGNSAIATTPVATTPVATTPVATTPAAQTPGKSKTTSSHQTTITRPLTGSKTTVPTRHATPHPTIKTQTKARTTPVQSWTIYNVDVRIGKAGHPTGHTNISRYTPLPRAATPRAMFAGVTTGGRSVVFELADGVKAYGPGLCEPDHARCSAIVLPVNEPEQLTFTDARGKLRTLLLKATRVRPRVTHSKSQELAAARRESADGRCELELSNPIASHGSDGSLTTTAGVSEPCRHAKGLVPFPGTTNGDTSVTATGS
jgi:hypothetical protein